MKVICRNYKTCINKQCFHITIHDHDKEEGCDYGSCHILDANTFCDNIKWSRMEKLKRLNKKSNDKK